MSTTNGTSGSNGTNGIHGTNGSDEPVSLPNARSFSPYPGLTLQPPLTRRGHGPSLILLVPEDIEGLILGQSDKTLDPPPLQKWAEEGFVVAQVTISRSQRGEIERVLDGAVSKLRKCPGYEGSEKIGIICMCLVLRCHRIVDHVNHMQLIHGQLTMSSFRYSLWKLSMLGRRLLPLLHMEAIL